MSLLFQYRWFDKSVSLIVTKDGAAGVNFEHSWGDGVAVLRYFQDICKDTTASPLISPSTKPDMTDVSSAVRRLGKLVINSIEF